MLALYRSGRQAEALEAFRHARRVLLGEVGLEPGPELRHLNDAILRQDPDLDGRPAHRFPARPRRSPRWLLGAAAVAIAAVIALAMTQLSGSGGLVAGVATALLLSAAGVSVLRRRPSMTTRCAPQGSIRSDPSESA